jgi:hypothetical protein
MMRSIGLMGLTLGLFVGSSLAQVPPESVAKPCVKTVDLNRMTRMVVHMTPFRGVNLVFPYDLDKDKTTVSLSSQNTWNVNPPNGSNLLTVYFSSFQNNWGELQDLTVKTEDHLVSIGLVADQNIVNHCSNIVFELSPEEAERIRSQKKAAYVRELDAQYEERMSQLDDEVHSQALALVGALSQEDIDVNRIKETKSMDLPNGDEIEVYVDRIERRRQFTMVLAEIENYSDVNSIYINSIKLLKGEAKEEIKGHVEFQQKLKPGELKELLFVSLTEIPASGARMIISTDKGDMEVEW